MENAAHGQTRNKGLSELSIVINDRELPKFFPSGYIVQKRKSRASQGDPAFRGNQGRSALQGCADRRPISKNYFLASAGAAGFGAGAGGAAGAAGAAPAQLGAGVQQAGSQQAGAPQQAFSPQQRSRRRASRPLRPQHGSLQQVGSGAPQQAFSPQQRLRRRLNKPPQPQSEQSEQLGPLQPPSQPPSQPLQPWQP